MELQLYKAGHVTFSDFWKILIVALGAKRGQNAPKTPQIGQKWHILPRNKIYPLDFSETFQKYGDSWYHLGNRIVTPGKIIFASPGDF